MASFMLSGHHLRLCRRWIRISARCSRYPQGKNIGHDAFTLESVYPASTPIYMELARMVFLQGNQVTGAVVKTAFCRPCFGARYTCKQCIQYPSPDRNFPNYREGSKIQNGQISSVALMDARSITFWQQTRDSPYLSRGVRRKLFRA